MDYNVPFVRKRVIIAGIVILALAALIIATLLID